MEFTAIVWGENYRFFPLNKNSFLISGNQAEYILYKTRKWNCADEISTDLLSKLGQVIEERLQLAN